MRKSGGWMTIWDDRILEILIEEESGTPSELAETDHIRVSRQQVSRRLQKLADHGLVNLLGNGVYVITDCGERYLDGELDTHEDAPEEPIETEEGPESADESESV